MLTEAMSNGFYLLLFFATLFVVFLILGGLVRIFEVWHRKRTRAARWGDLK